jgi:hypothetical protein
MADAACVAKGDRITGARLAQTFRALHTGQLTSASIFLDENQAGVDLDVEIWSVGETGAPSTMLAGTTLIDLPATTAPGPHQLTATFAAPASVVQGLRYALVVQGPSGQYIWLGSASSPRPEGSGFFANQPGDPWRSFIVDLYFATTVTA